MILGVVVEGHGEVEALPVLIRRIVHEYLERWDVSITRPIRMSRSRVVDKFPDLERQVATAAVDTDAVLVLFDSDDDCPAELGPRLLARAANASRGRPVGVVLAHREYEAWFLASIDALRGHVGVRPDADPPDDPEAIRDAKGRLNELRDQGARYSETVDQARLSARVDVAVARERAPSFDKLCRELERLTASPA